MLCRKPHEQARRAFSARAQKRDKRNVKSSVALEAKALVAVTATLRTMAKPSEDFIAAIEHEFRQVRASTKCCKYPDSTNG